MYARNRNVGIRRKSLYIMSVIRFDRWPCLDWKYNLILKKIGHKIEKVIKSINFFFYVGTKYINKTSINFCKAIQ